jgi:hypothetical protein
VISPDQPAELRTDVAESSHVPTDRSSTPAHLSERGSQDVPRDEGEHGAAQRAAASTRDAGGAADERWRRILAHQDADQHTRDLKAFLCGDLESLSRDTVVKLAKIADQFVIDEHRVLRYVSLKPSARGRPAKLVAPVSMRKDLLHHCHAEMQGGHQGITRTYERVRSEYYWLGMYNDVAQYCRECVDCNTGKGRPVNTGPSPGNIMPDYPFHVVSVDFVLLLPPSEQGNTALLLFQDMFSGYVMCRAMSDTSAPEVAKAYDQVVFQRFGASSVIRHDQDPVFISVQLHAGESAACDTGIPAPGQRAAGALSPDRLEEHQGVCVKTRSR